MWPNHTVEFPIIDDHIQDGAHARRRVHCRVQAA